MRLYVLCYSDYEGIGPHIVAEVAHDAPDRNLHTTLADSLAGERALIMTRAELIGDPVGRAALAAWERRDDTEFDAESGLMQNDESAAASSGRLRLVPEGRG